MIATKKDLCGLCVNKNKPQSKIQRTRKERRGLFAAKSTIQHNSSFKIVNLRTQFIVRLPTINTVFYDDFRKYITPKIE